MSLKKYLVVLPGIILAFVLYTLSQGFNNIIGQPDQNIHRKLSRLAFDLLGDAWEPFAYGQKAWAF